MQIIAYSIRLGKLSCEYGYKFYYQYVVTWVSICVISSQLLWFKALRQSNIFRLIIVFLILVSTAMEYIIIVLTDFHREFFDFDWSSFIESSAQFIWSILSVGAIYGGLFALMVGIYIGLKDGFNWLKLKIE